jgi:DNA repair exonuclease SbcCD ATPase subunit
MELELEGWKIKVGLAALAALVLVSPLACAVKSNKDRAEDWHRRAVVAEESVGGLRTVIVERSRALNQRTLQANRLVSEVHTKGTALRRTRGDVGALTRRQRELANANARIESERRRLQTQQARLETIAAKLAACTNDLAAAAAAPRRKAVSAATRARVAACARASASLDAYRRQSG